MLVKTRPIETYSSAYNLVPVIRELPADLETPVSVYMKLSGSEPSFLLESVTGGEHVARYSFIGVNPSRSFVLRGKILEERSSDGDVSSILLTDTDPLDELRSVLSNYRPQSNPGLPRFFGGLVGYLGYETAAFFEPKAIPGFGNPSKDQDSTAPDAIFLFSDTVIAFDHAFGKLLLIANARVDRGEKQGIQEAEARLDMLQEKLSCPLVQHIEPLPQDMAKPLKSNATKDQYCQAVLRAKDEIAAGEIFQVVLSQRFSRDTRARPFDIYRALRRLNPSPYMFFFNFGHLAGEQSFHLIGASPEMHVRVDEKRASIRPIAGTRPRGKTPEQDALLQVELLEDPKERAEHIMLVDLARNDLGRVCEYGSVQVSEFMGVERYSHVMHIVSHVEGILRSEYDGFDLLRATFPAGTVSGAPKIRAMQIISELENQSRGPYAGAVGYFSFDGSMDTCITIRTLVMEGSKVSVQAGAGIVADSDPEREFQETVNKARALAQAVEVAEGRGI